MRYTDIENISEYDLIVGKAGSSTGLVMNTVFYYGVPEGNIDISYLEELQNNKYVEKAVPLGMGDTYHGYKIIGTSTQFFDNESYVLKEGKFIENECDVVLGATVAKRTGLKLGDTFKSQHGLTENESTANSHHDENFVYTVVGILEPTNTPNDTVLFTTIETLWHAHGLHEHEEGEEEAESTSLLTAVLIRSRGLAEQNILYQELKKDEKIQVIIPTETLRSLLNSLKIGEVVITLIAAVSVGLSVIMLFITMLTSSIERRKDISILRALGASRKIVFLTIIIEIVIMALIGTFLGFLLAHIMIGAIGNYVVTNYGLNISGLVIQASEIWTIIITVLLSLLAGIIPAMMVYKTDATRYLK